MTHERKKLPWTNAGAVCLNFNLRRSSRAVTVYYDAALKPAGIKITQFTVLMAIAAYDGGSVTQIARLAELDRTTLTRSLRILKHDKLIENDKATGGNLRRLRITPAGIKKMYEAHPYWLRAQRTLSKALTPAKTRQLRQLLNEAKTSAEKLDVI